MKKLLKSIVIAATMMVMTMGMATLVSAMEPAVTVKETVTAGDMGTPGYYYWTSDDVISGNYQGLIVPITVTKPGVVYLNVAHCALAKDAFFEVYTDKNCDDSISRSIMIKCVEKEETSSIMHFKAQKAGTYYLKMYSITYEELYTNVLEIDYFNFSSTEKTVKEGTKYLFAAKDYGDTLLFKYKAPATGLVTFQTADGYNSYVELANAKKKSISNSASLTSSNKYATFFAVKKGKTYYFKLKPSSAGELNYFTLKFEKVKEKSGKKRKKAVSLKAKKKAKGTIQYGEKGDWYKFKLKKSGKLRITVGTIEQNYLKISLYDSKGKQIDSSAYLSNGKKVFTVTNGSRYGIANKGTYYVKIDRYSKKSSGYYELSWKH